MVSAQHFYLPCNLLPLTNRLGSPIVNSKVQFVAYPLGLSLVKYYNFTISDLQITLAILLGSDYSPGVRGFGPVG